MSRSASAAYAIAALVVVALLMENASAAGACGAPRRSAPRGAQAVLDLDPLFPIAILVGVGPCARLAHDGGAAPRARVVRATSTRSPRSLANHRGLDIAAYILYLPANLLR